MDNEIYADSYSGRIEQSRYELLDPGALRSWHNEGAEVLSRCFSGALSSTEPVALCVASLLLPLRVASVREIISQEITTLSVGENVLYVNGVAMASKKGIVRGESRLVMAIALHAAIHQIQFHSIRIAELFREFKEQGIVFVSEGVSEKNAWRIANLVVDALSDPMPPEVTAELVDYSHTLFQQHRLHCLHTLENLTQSHCSEGISPQWVHNLACEQSVPVIEVLRSILCSLDIAPANSKAGGTASDLSQMLQGTPIHVLPPRDDSRPGIAVAKEQQATIVCAAGRSVNRRSALARWCVEARGTSQ